MATKKDLVEAHAFSRRRLVTAFLSGAPGGREVEPARPGRTIVGGVALAVLLLAGAAVAGALTQRPQVDWQRPGLVTDDHGALYVILEEDAFPGQPRLRPVINVTSAQLILGAEVTTTSVPDDEIAAQPKGPPIGILDAPATVPPASALANSGWVACTGTGRGLATRVGAAGDDGVAGVERTPDLGFVVRGADSGRSWLVAEAQAPGQPLRAHRYELPPGNDGLLAALGLSPNDLVTVPDAWLGLFPTGDPLTTAGLGLAAWGEPAGLPGHGDARVGDYRLRDGTPYAITRTGLVELTPFAAAVLRNTPMRGGLPREVVPAADAPFEIDATTPYAAALWPVDVLADSAAATEEVCGVLVTGEGQQPAVRLALGPAGSGPSDGVAPGRREVAVAPGSGALVRTAEWTTSAGGSLHLVDDRGRTYSVAGAAEVANLGYAGVPAVVVPDTWNELFQPGPDLSVLAALCPPASGAATCG